MNGIDVSRWQPANITELVDYDFVIIKATEGTGYVSPFCDSQFQKARARGKLLGVYHFATGGNARAEAEFFVSNVRGYVGQAVLVLDWEAGAINRGAGWVREFVRRVKELTGVPPIIYGSASPLSAHGIPQVAQEENCGLWVAAYPNSNRTGYRDEAQLLGSVIRQYSSTGRLNGYNGDLDLNRTILTPDQWRAYARGGGEAPAPAPQPERKPIEVIANEVIAGAWGNGEDRKNRLTAAGYNPTEVQAIVNNKLGNPAPARKSNEQIADEVVAGAWGNGNERTNRLSQAGYDPNTIQGIVNKKLGAPAPARTYTVQRGDTLSSIAAKYGTTWQRLQQLNGIADANKIYAGQVIKV